MGVSLELWRCRIGTFAASGRGTNTLSSLWTTSLLNAGTSLVMSLILINILLLIGSVETNPGPSQFQCSYCGKAFTTVSGYGIHQNVHARDNNFRFPCPACGDEFATANAFRIHWTRMHSENKRHDLQETASRNVFYDVLLDTLFECTTCQKKCRTASHLRKHMNEHLKAGYVILCPFQPCINKFSKLATFGVHVSQYHKELINQDVSESQDGLGNPISDSDHVREIDDPPSADDASHFNSSSSEDDSDDELGFGRECNFGAEQASSENAAGHEDVYPENMVRDHIGSFYLMMEGELLIPGLKVQRISEEISLLLEMSHHRLRVAFSAELKRAGVADEKIEEVIDASLKKDTIFNVHHKGRDISDFTTAHLRFEFYRRKCVMLESTEIELGEDDAGKKRFAHFIPPDETLFHLLLDESVQEQVEDSFTRNSTPGVFQDFTDGSIFKNHPICSQMDCLQLICFQDAFSFYPLSPTAGTYKCVGFYFTLGNLHPNSRSKVDAIQLALLVRENDLKYFGAEKCLKPLIDSLKKLVETGMKFKDRTLPVVPIMMCGDNLGQHYIGGFLECFTSHFPCRFCEISKTMMKNEPTLTLPLRTPEDYDACVAQLNPEKCDDSVKGIKGNSMLNHIPTFHVCDPALAVCIAHDIWEGTAKQDGALFLRYFIDMGWIDLNTLNRRIENFKCLGRDRADSLVKLKPNFDQLSGHASEIWLFIRLLPFLIGDRIQNHDDRVWQAFLNFKIMCEYISAPKISEIQVAKLKQITELYVTQRSTLFIKPLQPKHHYMLHYFELIFHFGSLIRVWAMRFESRHVFFKQAAKVANNFKNITSVLMNKYVLNFAYRFTGQLFPPSIFFCDKDMIVPDKNALKPKVVQIINSDPNFKRVLTSVCVHGIEYTPGFWMILGSSSKDLRVGEIMMILYDGQKIKFVLKEHIAKNTFQGFFSIQQPEEEILSGVLLDDVEDYYPLPAYNHQNQKCLSLKHSTPCMDQQW